MVKPLNKTKCTILSNCGILKTPSDGMADPGRHNKTWIMIVQAIGAKTLLNNWLITR